MGTVYGKFLGEPITSLHEVSVGFISSCVSPIKPMYFVLGFYEALLGLLNPADKGV